MATVELDRLAKQFPGSVWAVRDLSLQISNEELIVFVGPSGCGKTTTLRMIAGLEEPTSGLIRINGESVNGLPAHRRNVAMMFQRPVLYPHLKVRDNLAFSLRLQERKSLLASLLGRTRQPVLSRAQIDKRIEETVEGLGLGEVLDRWPRELSGGQQQRVALGRALIRRPAVFMLDEPLAGLDLPLRNEMRRELHLLQRRLGATMIYVTHDQTEAMALGDRVVVMDRGAVQQVDRPQVLYERPCNQFVASFIGWPPMSLLEGELQERDGGLCYTNGKQTLMLPSEFTYGSRSLGGRSIRLGVRPEDVSIVKTSQERPLGIEMKVVLAESLGADTLLNLEQDGWKLNALVKGSATEQRERVRVNLNMERCYIFDRETGAALGRTGPAG